MCKGTRPSLLNAPCSKQLPRHQDFFLKKWEKVREKAKGRGGREPGSPPFPFKQRIHEAVNILKYCGTLSIADLLHQINPK